jgi:hypothetical protein
LVWRVKEKYLRAESKASEGKIKGIVGHFQTDSLVKLPGGGVHMRHKGWQETPC